MKGIILSPYPHNDQKIKTIIELLEHTATIEGVYNNPEYLNHSDNLNKLDFIFIFSSFLEKKAAQELVTYLEKNNRIQIIFLAEDVQEAAKAWPYFPAAFLSYPIEEQAITTALQKAKKRLSVFQKNSPEEDIIHHLLKQKIALPTTDGFIFVRYNNIIRCEAQGGYTQVFLSDSSSLLITKTLKHYDQILEDFHFFRVHKSHLVNLTLVRRFNKGKKVSIETIDGKTIKVSTRKRDELLHKLSTLA